MANPWQTRPSMIPPGTVAWAPVRVPVPQVFGPPPPLLRPAPAAGPRSKARGPQSSPAGGMTAEQFVQAMGAGIAAPFNVLEALDQGWNRPQGGNEPDALFLMRQGLTQPRRAVAGLGQQTRGAIGQFVEGLLQTPNDRIAAEYAALIGQESGGRQFDANGNPLIGRDSKGRVPGPDRGGAAFGVAQMQIGTARDTAKMLGIPFDEKRFYNDPNYNYQLGLAHYKMLREKYGNPALAAGAYHSGMGNVDKAVAAHGPANFVQGLGPEGQNYVQKVMGRMGELAQGFGAAPPAFNAAPFQQAMAAQDAAAALLVQPTQATFDVTPTPDMPEPTPFQAPDFTASDAAFEASRPKNPFDDPKERTKLLRSQYLKGIGEAIASLNGNEGIGTMLMKMGAGALMGRGRGDEIAMQREMEFERTMMEYNRALANREDAKAATLANVANQNIEQRNAYAQQLWQQNAQEIARWNPQVSADGSTLITFTADPENPNRKTMTRTPVTNAIKAEAILNKANIALQMGNAAAQHGQWAYQSQQATARTALGVAVQTAAQSGDPSAGIEGLQMEAQSRIRAAVQTNQFSSLFQDRAVADAIQTQARQRTAASMGLELRPDGRLFLNGQPADAKTQQAYNAAVEDDVVATAGLHLIENGNLVNFVLGQGTAATTGRNALISQRSANQRTTERVDARGNRTVSTSWTDE